MIIGTYFLRIQMISLHFHLAVLRTGKVLYSTSKSRFIPLPAFANKGRGGNFFRSIVFFLIYVFTHTCRKTRISWTPAYSPTKRHGISSFYNPSWPLLFWYLLIDMIPTVRRASQKKREVALQIVFAMQMPLFPIFEFDLFDTSSTEGKTCNYSFDKLYLTARFWA